MAVIGFISWRWWGMSGMRNSDGKVYATRTSKDRT